MSDLCVCSSCPEIQDVLLAGSCLVLKGNGADVAQHCVPPVNARRMSITLRRYTWAAVMHLAIL